MNPCTIITAMLGMNRFHKKDADHPFDMSALDGYNTIWMPNVDEEERVCSTLFYESLQAVEASRLNDQTKTKDDFVFVFGRGTIGSSQEEFLFEAWRSCMQYYGNDVNHIMVAKSFGVADTLNALSKFKRYHKKPNVKSLLFIDGFLPRFRRRKIAKKIHGEWKFKIPKFVNHCHNVIQSTKGTHGVKVVDFYGNFVVGEYYLRKTLDKKVYSEYSDGYTRKLSVCHFNMEEIVSAARCMHFLDKWLVLRDAIKHAILYRNTLTSKK